MRRALLITYDLNKPGQDYKDVHEAIKDLGVWWHYLGSTWIVVTDVTPSQAWDQISSAFDKSDRCLILDVSGDSYSGWLSEDAWEWIRKNLNQAAQRW